MLNVDFVTFYHASLDGMKMEELFDSGILLGPPQTEPFLTAWTHWLHNGIISPRSRIPFGHGKCASGYPECERHK